MKSLLTNNSIKLSRPQINFFRLDDVLIEKVLIENLNWCAFVQHFTGDCFRLIEKKTNWKQLSSRANWLSFGFPAELKLKTPAMDVVLILMNRIQFLFRCRLPLTSIIQASTATSISDEKFISPLLERKLPPKYAQHFKFLFITLKGYPIKWKSIKKPKKKINLNNLFVILLKKIYFLFAHVGRLEREKKRQ